MTNDEIIKLILKESDKIGDICNNHFLMEFGKFHNIKPKYNQLSAKQEVVAKKGYFMSTKKKYALWIINNEGVSVSEYDLKGLVIKRSDYPSYTKVKVQELIDMLLKEDKVSFSKIRQHISKTEETVYDMCKDGNKEIARPVTFTKKVEKYKTVPSSVLGMLLWNDLEYDYFVPGTKGYLFKILGIDPFLAPESIQNKINKINFKKNNTIVVPYEVDKLPSYYKIDTTSMVEFAWVNRYKEFLEPIWGNIDVNEKKTTALMTAF